MILSGGLIGSGTESTNYWWFYLWPSLEQNIQIICDIMSVSPWNKKYPLIISDYICVPPSLPKLFQFNGCGMVTILLFHAHLYDQSTKHESPSLSFTYAWQDSNQGYWSRLWPMCSSCTYRSPCTLHCKELIPKIRNKYSFSGNCAATVPISTSCVRERFVYSHHRSAYSASGNMWTDPENI